MYTDVLPPPAMCDMLRSDGTIPIAVLEECTRFNVAHRHHRVCIYEVVSHHNSGTLLVWMRFDVAHLDTFEYICVRYPTTNAVVWYGSSVPTEVLAVWVRFCHRRQKPPRMYLTSELVR